MLHAGSCSRVDLFTGGHRAGERDLVDARVGHKRTANLAHTLDDIIKPRRRARLDQDFGHLERAERRGLGGFEHHGVATGQCRRALPAGDLGGVVPRADPHTEAERFADGIDPILAQRDMLAGEACRQTAEILQRIGTGGGIRDQRFLQRFASVIGFQHRKLMIAFAHDLSGATQDAAPLGAGFLGPFLLRGLRRGQGLLDNGRGGGIDGGDLFAGGGVDHRDRGAGGIFNIGAIDKMAGFGLSRMCHVFRLFRVRGAPLWCGA